MTKADDEQKRMMREAFKEAAKEFMRDAMSEFGMWSFRTLAAAGVVALVYFVLSLNGWHR